MDSISDVTRKLKFTNDVMTINIVIIVVYGNSL